MKPLMAGLLAAFVLDGPPAAAQHHGERGRYGNPTDLDAYIARLADPARDAWQKPDEVVAALRLRPGQVACDVGAGPGYFTLRLARAVGPAGRVYAVDVEPKILDALRERLGASGLRNVTPVLALADDALLPAAACDVILIVDTYHHFPDRPAYLRRLAREALEAANAGRRGDAANKLQSFINEVEAQREKELTGAQAGELIGWATRIIGVL